MLLVVVKYSFATHCQLGDWLRCDPDAPLISPDYHCSRIIPHNLPHRLKL